jgi:hypothetical protein
LVEIELDLSLCVVAGKQTRSLRRLLQTLHATTDQLGFECLVAETRAGGTAALAALVDEFPGLMVVRLLGLTPLAAMNHLLRLSRGRYAALVDADLQLQPHCLHRLVRYMDDNPDVGLISPRIIDAYGKTEPSCHAFPLFLPLTGIPFPCPPPRLEPKTTEVAWCRSGLHLLRPELTEELGGLDAACGHLAELDLYWRARRLGWHRVYLCEAEAVHANPGRYRPEVGMSPAWPEQLRVGLRFLKKHLLRRAGAI